MISLTNMKTKKKKNRRQKTINVLRKAFKELDKKKTGRKKKAKRIFAIVG